ncbi:lipoprotein bor [Saccharobesus litoralis]|uniref:Lipoprotein bor n=1 Tax=Saccharobesus litoralis TaxID=2172099 RepID=A0A2S0VXT8_9ALTE|nr:Bor family protein [Saccharobesus litoralis]AWB68982.1 lipoprotein bor [Saccharobesus litoralis]
MKKLAILILSASLFGCATQTYHINGGAGKEATKEEMQAFFVSGLGQTQEMDAASICGGADKVAKVESHMSFLNGLLGGITWGIYTPRQARVYCKK